MCSSLRSLGRFRFRTDPADFRLCLRRCSLYGIMPVRHEQRRLIISSFSRYWGNLIGYGGHRPFLSLADRPGQGSRMETVSPVPTSCISVERLKVLTFP